MTAFFRRLRVLLLLALCAGAAEPGHAEVTRAAVIATADAYLTLRWKGTEANVHHGPDAEGVLVETPDRGFARPGTRPGWWVPGQVNVGMPYMWGGFSTPAEFAAGLKKGLYAGDIYTPEKRRLDEAAVSRQTVGIDCSGLISRCWGLPRAYSTRELPTLCQPLGSVAELKPGDILNSPNNHVLLFKAFAEADQQRLLAYEAGSPPTWKVLLNRIPLTLLLEKGYQPFRYRKIRD